ncbi:Hypothetical predicted protein [Octopus vulgaris]|uniref:Uncharacterized protein n=1 Tax=Octopus vulgaris TaxID=6645 RepID=A0AA36AIP1_OCTVU|nr:Hypothetical predicted protein [Octopus vulgaris]
MSARSASGRETSSGAEKCLEELSVGMAEIHAEYSDADADGAATVIARVLVAVVGVGRRDARLSFSFSI